MLRSCLCLILTVATCSATLPAAELISQPFEGVTYIQRTQTLPRQVSIHLLDIDLSTAGLRFRVTPSNGFDFSETTRQTTLDYVIQQKAQAAINGDFFSTFGDYAAMTSMNASNGDIYSPWGANSTRPSLNISQDNVATVVHKDPNGTTKTPLPNVPIYNALGGNETIISNGQNTASDTTLAPRTATGITADGRLLMLVVDGRQAGHSLGMSTVEVADLLISYGAVWGINHDGGGSTTMVLADTTPRVVNRPSDGTLRKVGNNLALFAPVSQTRRDTVVFSDFYAGDRGTFAYAPGYSGSTVGINEASSRNEAVQTDAVSRGWAQRLTIVDDPSVDAEGGEGWFVRHVSGAGASAGENITRPTSGWVGFWARTEDEGVDVALAIDDADNVTADRSTRRTLVADGAWHLYEWNLEDDAHWQPWVAGDGVIDTDSFTLDSIQLFGSGDVTVELDMIMHNAYGRLGNAVPEPATMGLMTGALLLALGRRR